MQSLIQQLADQSLVVKMSVREERTLTYGEERDGVPVKLGIAKPYHIGDTQTFSERIAERGNVPVLVKARQQMIAQLARTIDEDHLITNDPAHCDFTVSRVINPRVLVNARYDTDNACYVVTASFRAYIYVHNLIESKPGHLAP